MSKISGTPELVEEPEGKPEERDAQLYPDFQVRGIIDRYVCFQCWGVLIAQPGPGRQFLIFCPDCGPGLGFHTRVYAEHKTAMSAWDAIEAKRNLAEVLGLEIEPVDVEQTLKDIGF